MSNFKGLWVYKAFEAGFVATLVCHQGLLALLHWMGPAPMPYDLTPTPPFGVPAVISLAFWGGVWGWPIAGLLRSAQGAAYWWRALIAGAIGPSGVALFIVFPLKGMPLAGGWDPKIILGALLLNGAWGLGVGLWLRWRGGSGSLASGN